MTIWFSPDATVAGPAAGAAVDVGAATVEDGSEPEEGRDGAFLRSAADAWAAPAPAPRVDDAAPDGTRPVEEDEEVAADGISRRVKKGAGRIFWRKKPKSLLHQFVVQRAFAAPPPLPTPLDRGPRPLLHLCRVGQGPHRRQKRARTRRWPTSHFARAIENGRQRRTEQGGLQGPLPGLPPGGRECIGWREVGARAPGKATLASHPLLPHFFGAFFGASSPLPPISCARPRRRRTPSTTCSS
jgi:hypothetical protein